jgi:hypothetical protein
MNVHLQEVLRHPFRPTLAEGRLQKVIIWLLVGIPWAPQSNLPAHAFTSPRTHGALHDTIGCSPLLLPAPGHIKNSLFRMKICRLMWPSVTAFEVVLERTTLAVATSRVAEVRR